MPDDTSLTTRDELPPAVLALSPTMQRAWLARAQGATWREAARAAGVPVGHVWAWARQHTAFKATLALPYVHLDDQHRDVLERTLADGLDADADDKARDRALRAAVHVGRGLGIGVNDATSAPARVDVSITLDVADALSRPASARPPLDVDVLDAELVPVADTQPVRARVSSQRRRDE